ncbi:MAG TPA: glucans biosynthesis glucosyltransferase MdoH, partial [Candidatus Methylacidiphilales bacterium]|nr:glucans biosynthesis glucosyltransferase MdoH [Candidatus Methylacidiphilales bacterium]
VGFVLAVYGFIDKLRGGDPHHIMRGAWRKDEASIPLAATAIVVPVYNEDVGRVARAVANMWRSLEKTGQIEHFDFYICSDSTHPDRWVEEECAWLSLCQKLNAFGKIFYRKRRHRINGKSGNVADFCRRWGKRYRYMIVLDADSVMIGPTLVRLVRAMEANPDAGIIQTVPYMVLGTSPFRRILQFSSHLYGDVFSRGLSNAQMASGSYWGHNAIIRVAAFIEYCDLPLLPVPDPGKRHVLSHDTVEAALMRRAGYGVWIAYEEPGSYEEGPPNLSDMLTRDRRWCAGNLQHFWFLFARGIEMGSRLQIWIGLMGYLCSPLWLMTLVAGSFGAYFRQRFLTLSAEPEDLSAASSTPTIELVVLTLVLLFLPRVLGILTTLPRARNFGGFSRMLLSALLENVFSILLAPVLMMFHTIFVLFTALGVQIKWNPQNRADKGLSLGHCLKLYGWLTVLGAAGWPVAINYLGAAGWWLSPIFAGWILAPFLAWLTSGKGLGKFLIKRRLFVTPEEVHTPPELQGLNEDEAEDDAKGGKPSPLWVQALLSPYVQAVHLALVRQGSSGKDEAPARSLADLRERLIREGPQAIKAQDAVRLLWHGETVFWLHQELWSRPKGQLHASWADLQATADRSRLLDEYLLG